MIYLLFMDIFNNFETEFKKYISFASTWLQKMSPFALKVI